MIPSRSVRSYRACSQAALSSNPLRWDLSPDEIRTMTDDLITRIKKVYDAVGSLNTESVSAENTLKALAEAKLDYACESEGKVWLNNQVQPILDL